MCNCKIVSKNVAAEFDFHPSKEFLPCLLTALVATAPAFINALLACMASGGTAGDYKPGDRVRCQ